MSRRENRKQTDVSSSPSRARTHVCTPFRISPSSEGWWSAENLSGKTRLRSLISFAGFLTRKYRHTRRIRRAGMEKERRKGKHVLRIGWFGNCQRVSDTFLLRSKSIFAKIITGPQKNFLSSNSNQFFLINVWSPKTMPLVNLLLYVRFQNYFKF